MNLIQIFIKNYKRRAAILEEKGALHYFLSSGGYVLIIVLMVTWLLVGLVSNFIVIAQTNIGYMRKWQNRVRATYLAKSGVELSKYLLYADSKGLSAESLTGRSTSKSIDCYSDVWAIEYPEVPLLEDGKVKMRIIDENSKINLSVVANEFADRTKFYFMTQVFFLNMGFDAEEADVIHDWVDIDDSRMPYGAESADYYMGLLPPYSAKNNAMDSIDEMMMLRGMTPEIYYGIGGGNFGLEHNLVENNKGKVTLDMDKISGMTGEKAQKSSSFMDEDELMAIGKEKSRKLSDYFTVYGDRNDYTSDFNKININTASYRVLSALTDNMTADIVTEIIHRRQIKPFASVDEINDLIEDKTIRDRLSIKSYIFRIKSTAHVGNAVVTINMVYNRSTRKTLYWSEE